MTIDKNDYYLMFKRTSAWIIDWLLFMFVFINIYFFAVQHFSLISGIVEYMSPLLMISFGSMFAVFAEAVILFFTGSTVGKYMLGIKITTDDDFDLSFAVTLKRSWLFFLNGLGFGVVFVAFFAFICSFFYYRRHHTFEWDRQCHTTIVFQNNASLLRSVFLLLVMVIFSVCGIYHYRFFSLVNGGYETEQEFYRFKNDALSLIAAPLFSDGRLAMRYVDFAFVADNLISSADELKSRLDATMVVSENMVRNKSSVQNELLIKQKKRLNAFFSFVSCAITVKRDIISYLEEYSDDYFNGIDGIEFKHGDTRYFFELRLLELNDCVKKWKADGGE